MKLTMEDLGNRSIAQILEHRPEGVKVKMYLSTVADELRKSFNEDDEFAQEAYDVLLREYENSLD